MPQTAETIESYWWLPDASDNRIAGHLYVSAESESYLELFGRLHLAPDDFPDVLHGKSFSGSRYFTLRFPQLGRSMSRTPGPSYSSIYFSHLVEGDHLNSSELCGDVFSCSLAAFDWWIKPRGDWRLIQRDRTIAAEVDLPAPTHAATAAGLSAWLTATPSLAPQATGATLDFGWRLQLQACKEQPWEGFLGHYSDVATLIAVFTGEYSAPDAIVLARQRRRSLSVTHGRPEGDLWMRSSSEQLAFIDHDQVEAFLPEVLGRWLEFAPTIRPVLELYRSAEFSKMFSELRFLSLIMALEVLHRRDVGGNYAPSPGYRSEIYPKLVACLPSDITGAWRKSVEGRLLYANEYSLRRRLKELLDRCPQEFRRIVTAGQEARYLSRLVDMRNVLVHFDSDAGDRGPSADELFFASGNVAALLEVLLLTRVGVSWPTIMYGLERHRRRSFVLSRGADSWDRP